MTKDKLTIVVPNEEQFNPAPIPFGVITGDGVPDYDNIKSNGKRGGYQYSISIILNTHQRASVLKQVMEFWNAHKPKRAGAEPANFKNIVREAKDDYAGSFIMYAKTQTEFNGKPNVVGIVNHSGTKLDPSHFGYIGKGSEGRLAVTLLVYGDGDEAGVSVFLSAVKLTKFVKLEASGGVSAFGTNDKGDVEADETIPF